MLSYLPWVIEIANKRAVTLPAQSILGADDLVNEGMMAVSTAIDAFDPARGVKFTTYAARRVWGAMNDALRAIDPLPRLMRQRINAGMQDDIKVGSLSEVVARGEYRHLTLADELEDRASNIVEIAMFTRDAMEHLTTGLRDRERMLLELYYVEELTMKEIGRTIGLSESRVSQMHSQALEILRDRLAAEERK